MRSFILPSIPIILLSLLSAEKTLAVFSEDAFGLTNYGFKCADRIYKKYEIFAAAKKLCDVKAVNSAARIESYIHSSLPWIQAMSCPVERVPDVSFAQIPLFKDGTLYPLEIPPEARFAKDSNGVRVEIVPGTDYLIIDEGCGIVGAYIDHSDEDEQGARYEACTLLKTPEDIKRPLESQSNFCNYPPTRSPQGSPRGSPRRSPERTFSQSSSQASSKSATMSPSQSPPQSPQRSRQHSPHRSFRQSPNQSPRRSPEQAPEILNEQSTE